MKIEIRHLEGIKVIDLFGQIRISTQNEFKDFFDKLIEESGDETVILNMDGIAYLNSAGIGIIVDSYKKFNKKGGRLVLCNLVSDINKLFEVTKLNKFIEIYENEQRALEKIVI